MPGLQTCCWNLHKCSFFLHGGCTTLQPQQGTLRLASALAASSSPPAHQRASQGSTSHRLFTRLQQPCQAANFMQAHTEAVASVSLGRSARCLGGDNVADSLLFDGNGRAGPMHPCSVSTDHEPAHPFPQCRSRYRQCSRIPVPWFYEAEKFGGDIVRPSCACCKWWGR